MSSNNFNLYVFIIEFLFLSFIMCECDKIRSMDVKTPKNVHLSAFYKRSFAFYTVKSRMPIILTNLIDTLVRSKEEIAHKYSEAASEELKQVIGEISKFKYEVQTNKPLVPLTGTAPDVKLYNDYIAKQATEEGHTTHFNTIWLLTECYMYRRLKDIFENTQTLKEYDPFRKQKCDSYTKSMLYVQQMAKYLLELVNADDPAKKDIFISLLKLNLWGNKCDLSISLGKHTGYDSLFDTASLEHRILADQSEEIWEAVSDTSASSDIVDIVFDNAGYEVFTDLCLADYLISKKLARHIRMYVKTIPWFISDVMKQDFDWMLQQMKDDDVKELTALGKRWSSYICNGTWTIIEDDFWTTPFDYSKMSKIKPELYKKLSQAKLIIFKGDLNYRKLFGEINWEASTSVETALQGFHPSKLCTLRAVKADIVCGLKPGIAEKLDVEDPKWMETGEYGLIQFCGKVVKLD